MKMIYEGKRNAEHGKEKQFIFRILIKLLGGCLRGISGACGQSLFEFKDATVKRLDPVRLVTAGFLMLGYYPVREKKQALRS